MPFPKFFESKNSLEAKRLRPKLTIARTRLEINVEVIAAAALIFAVIYLVATWATLPDKVPMHYDFGGKVDRWGSKYSLLPMIGTAVFLYALLTLFQRWPHIYNYPFALTDQNREKQYLYARQLLTVLKAEVVCMFAFLTWQTIQVARGNAANLTIWFLPVILGLIFATIIIYFIKAYRAR